jgi:N-acetylneuraminic acid mutarotase
MFYMIGGTTDRNSKSSTNWVDRYDPKTGKWKKLADAPRTRDHFHTGICNGKIYAAGGRNTFLGQRKETDRTIAEVDVFNIESGRWKTLPESQNLPTPRAGCATVVIMDHILVIGGESTAQAEAYDLVEAYDVDRGVWEQWDALNQGRQGTQAFMCVGSVFITAGSGSRDSGNALTSIERLTF